MKFVLLFITAVLLTAATLTFVGDANAQSAETSWNAGRLYVPAALSTSGSACTSPPGGKCAAQIKTGKHGVVLYLHGCPGPRHYRAFQEVGAIVVSPDSFAGGLRCKLSDPKTMSALYKARTADIDFALAQLKAAPWADPAKLVLAGFSNGGAIAATYNKAGFKARVILAWVCHSPDNPGSNGIRGTGPVLAVYGTADEVFEKRGVPGKCGEYVKGRGEPSQYLSIPGGPHDIVDYPATRSALAKFVGQVLQ